MKVSRFLIALAVSIIVVMMMGILGCSEDESAPTGGGQTTVVKMWVTQQVNFPFVHRINSLGEILSFIRLPEGYYPDVTWDGTNLWCCDALYGNVYKFNPQDGSIISEFQLTKPPIGLAWDGNNIWCYTNDFTGAPQTVSKRNTSDFSMIEQFTIDFEMGSMTWVDGNIWAVDWGNEMLVKIDPATGNIISQIAYPGESATGIGWDGDYMWTVDNEKFRLYQFDIDSGEVISDFTSQTAEPLGIAMEG